MENSVPHRNKGANEENTPEDKEIVMMSFNMPVDWHTRFKMTAVSRQISMKDLLVECFACWEKQNKGS